MNTGSEAAVALVAERQHGLITVQQAKSSGLLRGGVRHRVLAGRWRHVGPGLYAIAGSPPSWEQAVLAAVLACRPWGAASHLTAAHLWGLVDRRPDTIEVIVPRDRRRRRGIIVHQSNDLLAGHVTNHRHIPVTLPVRTFVDMGCVGGRRVTEDVLDESLRRGLFTLDDAGELIARLGRRGRNGVGVAREIVAGRLGLDAVGDSWLENRFLRIVRAAGLPEPTAQFEVVHAGRFVCRVDFAWPDAEPLTTVELDSERHHLDRTTFRRDRQKDRGLRRLGITALRFTAWDLRFNPEGVGAELAGFLDLGDAMVVEHAKRPQFRELGERAEGQMRGFST
jgi:hypothetical protein